MSPCFPKRHIKDERQYFYPVAFWCDLNEWSHLLAKRQTWIIRDCRPGIVRSCFKTVLITKILIPRYPFSPPVKHILGKTQEIV